MNDNANKGQVFRPEWKVTYKCHDPADAAEWRNPRFAYVAASSADEAAEKVRGLMKMFRTDIIGEPTQTGDMTDAEI